MNTDPDFIDYSESGSAARAYPTESRRDDFRRERKASGVQTLAGLPTPLLHPAARIHPNRPRLSIELLPYDRKVMIQGCPFELTPLQFQILVYLVENAGRVVSPDEFASSIFRSAEAPDSSKLRVHIHGLRRRLGALGRLIESVRGKGYRIGLCPD